MLRYALSIALASLAAFTPALAQFSRGGFGGPDATSHYAPDRVYDLQHVKVELTADPANMSFKAVATNTLVPIRDGLTEVVLDCGSGLQIASCSLNGKPATFKLDGEKLHVSASSPLPRGKLVTVELSYSDNHQAGRRGLMGRGGMHWIRQDPNNPNHTGFWTQGESMQNHEWLPTWDYPNDFATSEEIVTVPADWTVIGNGDLVSNKLSADKKTRTFHWRLMQPHATYLISLVAGPMDSKTASWNGVKLRYSVPKGEGNLIDDSFGDTPDMLSFFSQVTGVKYPWPQYAETAAFEFGGGMENVSAATLGEGALTDKREGFHTMDSLNSHELAHQWFGDLATCKDWGNTWLNEGFATFFEALYMEHSRGKAAYEREIENDMRGYFGESRAYERAIATNVYTDADAMFDGHTYSKGAAILHTMRRYMGDGPFFAGLKHYLTVNYHQPVETQDLCKAMTEATGVNMCPFFDQWVYKPGHPVLEYTWTWDDAKHQVVLTVKQTQDTKNGTPEYDLPVTVGFISGSDVTRQKAHFDKATAELRFDLPKRPDAVLLDPDHDFLREIPNLHWAQAELIPILRSAPNANDRQAALNRLLNDEPSDAAVAAVAEAVRADNGQFTVFSGVSALTALSRPELRGLYREMLKYPNPERRASAIRALADYPKDEADEATLRSFVNENEPYSVVVAAMDTLGVWDAKGNVETFRKAAKIASHHDRLKHAAERAIEEANPASN